MADNCRPASPSGVSVNDGIDTRLCTLTYASLDNVVELITKLGWGSELDLKDAYRIVLSTLTTTTFLPSHGRGLFTLAAVSRLAYTIDILDYVNGIGNGRHMLNHAVHSYASRLCWSD